MKITNRLDALHALCEIRRLELSGEDATRAGFKRWDELMTACDEFFAADDPVWVEFAETK